MEKVDSTAAVDYQEQYPELEFTDSDNGADGGYGGYPEDPHHNQPSPQEPHDNNYHNDYPAEPANSSVSDPQQQPSSQDNTNQSDMLSKISQYMLGLAGISSNAMGGGQRAGGDLPGSSYD